VWRRCISQRLPWGPVNLVDRAWVRARRCTFCKISIVFIPSCLRWGGGVTYTWRRGRGGERSGLDALTECSSCPCTLVLFIALPFQLKCGNKLTAKPLWMKWRGCLLTNLYSLPIMRAKGLRPIPAGFSHVQISRAFYSSNRKKAGFINTTHFPKLRVTAWMYWYFIICF
jgi:hypothetical protein